MVNAQRRPKSGSRNDCGGRNSRLYTPSETKSKTDVRQNRELGLTSERGPGDDRHRRDQSALKQLSKGHVRTMRTRARSPAVQRAEARATKEQSQDTYKARRQEHKLRILNCLTKTEGRTYLPTAAPKGSAVEHPFTRSKCSSRVSRSRATK